MSKRNSLEAKRARRNAKATQLVFREGINTGSDPQLRANYTEVVITDPDEMECISIRIGNVTHLIHSETAVYLRNYLTRKLEEWNTHAKAHGSPGLPRKGQSDKEFFMQQHEFFKSLGIDFTPFSNSIPEDGKL